MITHPAAYNIVLRPYYVHMTAVVDKHAEALAAACLLDVFENVEPLAYDPSWIEISVQTLYDILHPFVANRPVLNALQWLEQNGLIESRHDPNFPTRRVKQYRICNDEVERRIACWVAYEGVNYAPLRIIQPVTREQGETMQNMHNYAVDDMAKIHAGNSDINSNTPIQQDMKVDDHYESTMALLYVLLGVEVFPVVGKKPAPKTPDDPFGWEWSKKRLNAPGRQMATMHAWKVATGYGMLPVKGSNLVFIDIDRSDFERKLMELLPRLASTYRQQRGDHACIAVKLPCSLESRYQIEDEQGEIASIRNHNSYQVGAGSVHPSGERYVATNMVEPITLTTEETTQLIGLFDALKPKQSRPSTPTLALVNPVDPLTVDKGHKTWAKRGQDQALRELSSASQGNFNTTLYKTACRLANLAKVTGDSTEQLYDLLWDVCEQAGYVRRDGGSATWSTIRSGVRAGEQLPLNLPQRKAR